jgi:hypothetical protein
MSMWQAPVGFDQPMPERQPRHIDPGFPQMSHELARILAFSGLPARQTRGADGYLSQMS